MYVEYFGLTEAPFSISPDPHYLFMSEQHREALGHLLYSIESDGGFVLLTGEVGTGKTTVCRCLLDQLPKDCVVAFIINPRLNVQELLSTICDEFGIHYPKENKSVKIFIDLINAYLLDAHAKGRRSLLIIDEAQNLSRNVLEQIRLLTNLETNKRKLLQIILLGQPELREKLARPELRQLSQRIIARYHLRPLARSEIGHYLSHRLAVAGCHENLFLPSTLGLIYRQSGGIPRLVNVICDRALLGAYSQGKRKVDRITALRAADEVLGKACSQQKRFKALWWTAAGFVLFAAGGLSATFYGRDFQSLLSHVPLKVRAERTTQVQVRMPVPPVGLEQDEAKSRQEKAAESSSAQTSVPIVSQVAKNDPEQPPEQADSKQTVPQPGPEAPALVSMEKLADLVQTNNPDMAYRTLFEQWRAVFKPLDRADACRQAEAQGLRCFLGQGGLDDLRKWNRPAVLKLKDGRGKELYAALTALQEGYAVFNLDNHAVRLSKEDLIGGWSGEYTLLWRPPPEYRDNVRLGQKGPMVEWLKSKLSHLGGETVDLSSQAVFDDTLAQELKKFQLSNDLRPDGIAGPQTLSRLLDEADHSRSPVLIERKEEP